MLRTDARRTGEHGSVTAETAVVLPILVGVTITLVWLVSLGLTHVRVVDAARETARALARDEAPATAIQLGRRVAPDGSRISVEHRDGLVVVHVVSSVHGPGGVFAVLPVVEVDAEATAAEEPR